MEKGLTATEAQKRLQKFGRNELSAQQKNSALLVFFSQFPTVINAVLATASLISFLINDTIDGVFIATILVINALVGFIQEYKAEKSLEKLKQFISPLSRVFRDGLEVQIKTAELVPGDVVVISEGERIPGDGTLLLSHHIEIDESIINGESMPVIKKQNDLLLSGTLVVKGKGHILLSQTGDKTRLGTIAKTLSTLDSEETPLQKQLNSLGKVLSLAALLISLSLIPIGIMQHRMLFPMVLLAISIGIAAIPESLPAVITISLAIGTSHMAKRNAIVRKMQAVETLGSVGIILVDKTGTLTQNSMRVKKFWTKTKNDFSQLVSSCLLGNTALLVPKDGGKIEIVGDRTDGALLLFAKDYIDNNKTDKNTKILDEYVFDPQTKTITTVYKTDEKIFVSVRGAPETILTRCKLSKIQRRQIDIHFEQFAKEGLRVIAFAKKEEEHLGQNRDHLENNLTFLGLLGLYDPPRPEVKLAIETAKKAGIKTVMVTGDSEPTARAIAKEIGLLEKNDEVITGDALARLSDESLLRKINKIRIFARSQPEDKLRLVELFKSQGYIVGVTGDGVNDALALKRADVGVAMGDTGTEVAKEAAAIVLTDDNFSTLVHAIEEGRTIYNNIIKAIMYLLTGNLAELSLVFAATVLGLPAPLLPTQILWINLVTDGLPALALASDTKNPNQLLEKPRDPSTPILTKQRIIFIASVGFGLAALLLALFSFLLTKTPEIVARTITFNLLIFLHLMIAFVVRGQSLFRINKLLVLGIVVTLLLQIMITTVPFFQTIFHLSL